VAPVAPPVAPPVATGNTTTAPEVSAPRARPRGGLVVERVRGPSVAPVPVKSDPAPRGFSMAEMVMVVSIIGILAAIAIPAFLGQRARAQDTEGKAAARQAQTAMETWYTDNQTYVGADKAALQDIEESLKSDAGASLVVGGQGLDTYKVTVAADSTNTWSIEKKAGGTVERTCVRNNTKGSCPAGQTW
jgi:type IV pilus assembly protein PilA